MDISALNWFAKLSYSPDSEGHVPLDQSPVKPREIFTTLKDANQNASSGSDGIPYRILIKLSSTDHILATSLTKAAKYGAPPAT